MLAPIDRGNVLQHSSEFFGFLQHFSGDFFGPEQAVLSF